MTAQVLTSLTPLLLPGVDRLPMRTIEPTGEIHEAATVFPMLPEDELQDLAADIKANGLIHPIVLDEEGALIDGRNRLAACRIAGVDPTYTSLNGTDPVAYILSANVARRNLTKGQRAMAIAQMGALSQSSLREIETEHGISNSRLAYASTVLRHARELADQVMAGTTSLDEAYAKARQRKEDKKTREELAERAEHDLAVLRVHAPDLADLVAEDRMSLREAVAASREREERREERRREVTMQFGGVITELYGLMVETPEQIIEGWVDGLVQQCKIPALDRLWKPDGLRDLARSLGAVADAMDTQGRSKLR